jgi:hypothetical protein
VRNICCDGACSPIEKQLDASRHVTPLNELPPPDGLGLAMTDQRVPSQPSMSVRSDPEAEIESPTATQFEVPTQETPFNPAPCPGVGLGICDHELPSQRATSVCAGPVPPTKRLPTAVQNRTLAQDTASKPPITVSPGVGVTDHAVPSQCSTSE